MKKTYIITGASSDIGQAFISNLDKESEEETTVFCQYYSNCKKLVELQDSLNNLCIIPFQCDLSQPESICDWIKSINYSELIPTHVLHLAASQFNYMRLKDFEWDSVIRELNMQVNSLGQIFREYLPRMAKARYGKVAVMLTAYTVGVPPKFMTHYLIAKHALLGLVKGAASEYNGKGITINGLSPNMIETKFLSNIDKRVIEINAAESAMKRNIEINEVVDGLNFLPSDASNYMNGVNLNMSGGDRM